MPRGIRLQLCDHRRLARSLLPQLQCQPRRHLWGVPLRQRFWRVHRFDVYGLHRVLLGEHLLRLCVSVWSLDQLRHREAVLQPWHQLGPVWMSLERRVLGWP